MQNFREILERQKAYFNTDATKSYEWRIDQLDRLERLLKENAEAFYEALPHHSAPLRLRGLS
jgi:aldehyde dehydrogenase (NAD+)